MRSLQVLHNVSVPQPTDLRARRRRQTTWDIHDAALRLAREQGFDNVTIEQISAEAGVSQRTFFNYFPTKESAVAFAPLEIPDDLATEFVSRGKARRSVVMTALGHGGSDANGNPRAAARVVRRRPDAAMADIADEAGVGRATLYRISQRGSRCYAVWPTPAPPSWPTGSKRPIWMSLRSTGRSAA